MRHVIASIEPAEYRYFQHYAHYCGGQDRQQQAEPERTRHGGEGSREIGSRHVQGAVGQIDEIHDAEHQG